MNIGHFNFLNNNNNSNGDFITEFLESLKKLLQKSLHSNNSEILNALLPDTIYAITDIEDKKLSLIDIHNGIQTDINIDFTNKNNTFYTISKEDFSTLDLGKFVTVKNNSIIPFTDDVKIENKFVASQLEDIFFCLDQEKNSVYSVTEICDNKIFLTDTKEGGHFSILKEIYPDFKVGDLLKKVDGKYTLIS